MSAHRSLDREAPHDVVPGVFRHRPLEHLGHAAHRTGRDRNPRRERLEQRDRSALVARGERDHVHGRIEPREVAAPAQPEHPALHPEPAGALPELSLPLPSAPHHEQPPGGTVHAAEPRAGVQHQLVVLDRDQPPHDPHHPLLRGDPQPGRSTARKRVSSSPSGTTANRSGAAISSRSAISCRCALVSTTRRVERRASLRSTSRKRRVRSGGK